MLKLPNDVIDFFTGSNLNYGRIYANSEGLNLDTVANRHMIFSKGSSGEIMRISTSGNVGIGTTAPSSRLEIASYNVASSISDVGANSLLTLDTTVNTGINLKAGITNNYNAYIQGYNSQSTSSRSLVLNPFGGNVGIGTTSPASIMEINGGSSNGVKIIAANSGTEFVLNASTSNGESRLWVGGAGNVGIGTTSPGNKLQVTGGSIGIDSEYAIRDNKNNTILQQSASTLVSNRTLLLGNATYSNIVVPSGNVGIGTSSPGVPLDSLILE
jgi:hypothetical protein